MKMSGYIVYGYRQYLLSWERVGDIDVQDDISILETLK